MSINHKIFISLAVFALFLLPYAVYPLGIAYDYPNHIARVYLEGTIGFTAEASQYYFLKLSLVPDLAMDIAISWLVDWFGIYLSAQLFSMLAVALLPLGAMLIHLQLYGRWSPWPLLAVLAMYNTSMMWGLVNYIFAVGMALIAFVGWIRYVERPSWPLAFAFLVLNLMLLFAHAFGLLVIGFLVLTWELNKLWQTASGERQKYLLDRWYFLISFGAPLALLIWATQSAGDFGPLPFIEFAGLLEALRAGFDINQQFDGAVIAALLMAILVVAVHARVLHIHPSMRFTLLCFLCLVLAMPHIFLGIAFLHIRLPPVFLCLFFGASSLKTTDRGANVVIAILSVAVLAASQFMAWRTLSARNAVQVEFVNALRTIEPGSRVVSGWRVRIGNPNHQFQHAQSFAVIEANAYAPNLFTTTSIVKVKPEFQNMRLHGAHPLLPDQLERGIGKTADQSTMTDFGNLNYFFGWDRNFDYLLWLETTDDALPKFSFLEEVSRGSRFILYKINR